MKNPWQMWVALFGAVLPGAILVAASPLLNKTAMLARDLNEVEIGTIRTCEILLNACLTIFLSTRLTKLSPRVVAMTGAGLTLIGNLAAIPGHGFVDLLLARLMTGAGIGCLVVSGAAIYAQLQSPQRVAGALLIPWTLGSVTTASIGGRAAEAGSQAGLFGLLAVMSAIAFVAVSVAPRSPPQQTGPQASFAALFSALRQPFALGFMVLFVGSTATWHFFAMIGASHGIQPGAIGQVIAGVGVIGSIVTAIGAVLMRDQWVRVVCLCAPAAFGAATIVVPNAPGELGFIAAYAIQSISYVPITVAMPALGLRLDATGKLNAAAQGWQTFANAFAPAMGGAIVHAFGHSPLSFVNAACAATAFVLVAFATRNAMKAPPSPLIQPSVQ
jgi:predicted MFS family arabinose efflux permease